MKIWYQPSNWSLLLSPLSGVYRLGIGLRRYGYRLGLLRRWRAPVPVIVIGNLTVGGTGKTPLVHWLVAQLQQKGYRPGVVSRGYSGQSRVWPKQVTAQSDPRYVGDEAVLTVYKTGCPMVVSPNRVEAVHQLLHQFDCDIVISDDGLQHYALARDIEMVVVDGERGFGNRCCLPAGPLREPVTRLHSADFIVINHSLSGFDYASDLPATLYAKTPVFSMQFELNKIYNVANPSVCIDLSTLQNRVVHAVAAIGHPNRFFTDLRSKGLRIIPHVYPDHYLFTPKDIQFGNQDDVVIMTEKDAIKCRAFAQKQHWCWAITPVLEDAFYAALMNKIETIVGKERVG